MFCISLMIFCLGDKMASIKKANFVNGRTLRMRDVSIADAAFILKLRLDSVKSKYLSPVSESLDDQINWIEAYKERDDQAYFIIEYEDLKIGTVRIYDGKDDSFCWGSWILIDDAPVHAALESALIVYSYALNFLGFYTSHFDVRKDNLKVCRFHEKFGAHKIGEDEINFFYKINTDSIERSLKKFEKYLKKVEVDFK